MKDLAAEEPTVFLMGTAGALAGALEGAGFRVLGHVSSLDLFFPLARHSRARVVLYGPEEGEALRHDPAAAVAQLRILAPGAVIGVLAQGDAAELTRAGADHVFLPPFDPGRIAAALGGSPLPRGNGRESGWSVLADQPTEPDGTALALLRAAAWREHLQPRGPRRLVAVLGARGGVGRTFLAVNLAAAAALAGRGRVLLLDLGGWGDAITHLDVQPGTSLIDLLPHLSRLDGDTFARHLRTDAGTGLHVLPGVPRPELDDLVTAEHVERLLDWAVQRYDLAFAVAPTRNRDDRLALCARRADVLVLVTTAETTALRQVGLLLDWLEKRQVPWRERLHLVVNRAGREPLLSPAQVERWTGLRPAAVVPEDRRAVEQAILAGRCLAASRPDHPLSRAVWQLASLVLPGQVDRRPPGGTWSAWGQRLFGRGRREPA